MDLLPPQITCRNPAIRSCNLAIIFVYPLRSLCLWNSNWHLLCDMLLTFDTSTRRVQYSFPPPTSQHPCDRIWISHFAYNQFVIVGIIFTVTLPHHAHLSAHILNASTSPPIQSPSSTVQFLFPLALWCRTSISSSWHSKSIFSKLHLPVDQKKRLTIVWPHSTPSNYVYTTRTRGKGLLGVLDLKIGWSFCSKFFYFTICLQY
jgi:hypothetical protein